MGLFLAGLASVRFCWGVHSHSYYQHCHHGVVHSGGDMMKVVFSCVRGSICFWHSGGAIAEVVLSRVPIFGLLLLSPAVWWLKSGFGWLFFCVVET